MIKSTYGVKCTHRDAEKYYHEETSYEYFESFCEPCYRLYQERKLEAELKHLASYNELKLQLNKYERYSVLQKDRSGKSGTGYWLVRSIKPEDVPTLLRFRKPEQPEIEISNFVV